MAISRQKKQALVAQYDEQLERSQGVILADYRGLKVAEMDELRRTTRPLGSKVQVVKNRLLALVLERRGVSLPAEWLVGPTAVGFCFDEVPPVAKAFVDTAKNLEGFKIKGGLLGEVVIDAEQVRSIAGLPSREMLLAQVLGTINAPATQTAGVIAAGIRQVLNVLQAYVDKLEEQQSPSPA